MYKIPFVLSMRLLLATCATDKSQNISVEPVNQINNVPNVINENNPGTTITIHKNQEEADHDADSDTERMFFIF